MFRAYDKKEDKFYNVKMLDFERNCFSIDNLNTKTWIDLEYNIDPYQGRYILFFNKKRVKKLSYSGIELI